MIRLIVLTAAALATGPALASLDLATKKGCTGCHAVDKKLVGPAYKDVAAKYKADKNAVAYLSERIQKGSVPNKLVWGGPIPMPANNVTAEEAKTLATWVLTVK